MVQKKWKHLKSLQAISQSILSVFLGHPVHSDNALYFASDKLYERHVSFCTWHRWFRYQFPIVFDLTVLGSVVKIGKWNNLILFLGLGISIQSPLMKSYISMSALVQSSQFRFSSRHLSQKYCLQRISLEPLCLPAAINILRFFINGLQSCFLKPLPHHNFSSIAHSKSFPPKNVLFYFPVATSSWTNFGNCAPHHQIIES